jgi:hypothetical protein
MPRTLRRPVLLTAVFTFVLLFTAATQAKTFPVGVFKANDGTNNISLDFDSTGTITAYINGETFSSGTYSAKADTLTSGPVTGPEGYACAGSGKYLWSFAENRLTMTLVTDECQVRIDAFTGLVWTKG